MPTPILRLPLVSPNQNQKETTINTALAILEAAGNDARLIDATTNANVQLTQDQFTRYLMQRVQNNSSDITVRVPALKRFFVAAAEGTGAATFWPQGGSPTINGAKVPAGTISLLMSDGTNIRALSSGVTRLQDLTDVITTPVMDGQVLAYILAEEKWRPATIAEVLNVAFIGLTDSPNSYVGQSGKMVRVKETEDGVEFIAPEDVAGAQTFLGLGDTPATYLGSPGMVVVVNETMDGLAFAPASTADFLSLTDAPASYVGQAGKAVFVNDEEGGLIFKDVEAAAGGGITVNDEGVEIGANITDVDFVGPGVSVEAAGENGATVTIAPDFVDLGDVPADYEGQAGKLVRVKAGEDGLEFGDAVDAAFTDLTDTPGTYVGQKKKLVAVKTAEDGVEFVPNQNASVIAAKTGPYTAVLDDAFAVIPFDVSAETFFTLPNNSVVAFPLNTQITVVAQGTGKVGIATAAGVTVVYPGGLLPRTRTQWSTVMALKIATNTWLLMGDMEAEA